jgi:hypothetical protein
MRNRLMASIVALVAVSPSSVGIFAQGDRPPQAARAATAASVPDLSGLWAPVGTNTFDPADPNGKRAADLTRYPMSPLGLEKFNANKVAHGANQQEQSNDPTNKCFPPGAPRSYVNPYPVEFVQSRNRLAMLFEYDVVYRIVYLDGRPHPVDGVPTWMGHSVGKWEGDTLVVHSTGFNGKSWLDRIGHPYSEELQLTERFRLVDKETLQLDITFHDPKMYTRDWTGQKIFKLKPTWELKEYVCEDNYTFDDLQNATGGGFVP